MDSVHLNTRLRGRTLFVCTADSSDPAKTVEMRTGRIETTRVDVPGAT